MIFQKFIHFKIIKINWFSRSYHSNYSVLFFGTDNFSLPSLKLLSKETSLLSRLEVVTSFKSHNNPVKQFACENKLTLHNWEDIKQSNLDICKQFNFGLVVSFGHLITENIINSFHNGMLNLHASLLPAYRGASPIIYAIKDNQKITGVTIMKIEPKKFDIGAILAKKKVPIESDMLMPQLHDNLANIGATLLVECLKNYDNLKPIKQDDKLATYAPKINNEFCKIRWNQMAALDVYNLYRSLYGFKHIHTTFRNEQVKLLEINLAHDESSTSSVNLIPGQITFCRKSKRLLVACLDGRQIDIRKLSIAKKVMSALDFNNGFLRKNNAGDVINSFK